MEMNQRSLQLGDGSILLRCIDDNNVIILLTANVEIVFSTKLCSLGKKTSINEFEEHCYLCYNGGDNNTLSSFRLLITEDDLSKISEFLNIKPFKLFTI